MARIRTIKPEFWEDEVIGSISRDARLLFLGCLNQADDEGLLRWNPEFLKSSIFMYDHDVSRDRVQELMDEAVKADLVLPYVAGKVRQSLGWIVTFRRHQVINRPQRSKLPHPPLQNAEVKAAYGRRDRWTCYLCGRVITPESPLVSNGFAMELNTSVSISLDHSLAHSKGGSDYPSNICAVHGGCNKSKGDRPAEKFSEPLSVKGLPYSVSDSVDSSLREGKGMEGKGMEQGKGKEVANGKSPQPPPSDSEEASDRIWKLCPKLMNETRTKHAITEAVIREGGDREAVALLETMTAKYARLVDPYRHDRKLWQKVQAPWNWFQGRCYLDAPETWIPVGAFDADKGDRPRDVGVRPASTETWEQFDESTKAAVADVAYRQAGKKLERVPEHMRRYVKAAGGAA